MAEYQHNYRAFGEFMKSELVQELLRERAEEGARYVRATVGRDHSDQVHYSDNVRVETGVAEFRGDRAAAYVVADVDYATVLEVGSDRIPHPPRPLSRAVDHIEGG